MSTPVSDSSTKIFCFSEFLPNSLRRLCKSLSATTTSLYRLPMTIPHFVHIIQLLLVLVQNQLESWKWPVTHKTFKNKCKKAKTYVKQKKKTQFSFLFWYDDKKYRKIFFNEISNRKKKTYLSSISSSNKAPLFLNTLISQIKQQHLLQIQTNKNRNISRK